MKVVVEFGENKIQTALIGDHKIMCDQEGPDQLAPEPYDYFAASLALCAGYYLRIFCNKRDISDQGFELSLDISKNEQSENDYSRNIVLDIKPPASFPKKYLKALSLSVEACTVKKVIQSSPNFKTNIIS